MDIPNIDAFLPGSREAANAKREFVDEAVLKLWGASKHLWFTTDDMAILSYMLDVNILCWNSTRQIWCWYNKMQFIYQSPFFFDESKPTIFMKQVGDDHFFPLSNELLTTSHQPEPKLFVINLDSSTAADKSEKDVSLLMTKFK
uniref:Uncharacterized protein n=1 Tax=Panagrolaimus sp. ES5 TaxID=591445 RepID=A0AC34G820_9BILA